MHTRARSTLLAIGLAAVILLAIGCDDAARLDNFDVEVTEQTVVEKASPLELLLGSFPQLDAFTRFDITDQADFQNSKYSPDDVDSIHLSTFTMRVVMPDGQDLAFLGSMVLYLETDGLPRKEIARCDDFPAGQTSVDFETTGDDLKPYVLARESHLTVEVNDSRRPEQDTTLELQAIFDVDIKVF